MKSVIERYGTFLSQLKKHEFSLQFQKLSLKQPANFVRPRFINKLLQGDLDKINQRVKQLSLSDQPTTKQRVQDPESQIDKYLKVQHRRRQKKILELHQQIYKDMTARYEFKQNNNESNEEEQNIFNIDQLQLGKRTPLQSLLEIQTQIKIQPKKVQHEYHHNANQLLDSFITFRTEDYLKVKQKQLMKKMMPNYIKVKGNTIESILTLYGIKKEHQFLNDLQDPLQTILTQNKLNKKMKSVYLNRLIHKLPTRMKYYQSVVKSLDLDQLHYLVQEFEGIKDIPYLSVFQKQTARLQLAALLRQNNYHFHGSYYSMLTKKFSPDQLSTYTLILDIQGWILNALISFKRQVQIIQVKQHKLQFMQGVLLYKKIKRYIQNSLEKQVGSLKQETIINLARSLQQYVNPVQAITLFQTNQSDQFNQKIQELIIYLDRKNMSHSYDKLYAHILEYLAVYQQGDMQTHILEQIAGDHLSIFQKVSSFNASKAINISEEYLNNFIEIMSKNSSHIPQNMLQQVIFLAWKHYGQLHQKTVKMTSTQGHSFLSLTLLCKSNEYLRGNVLQSKQYLFLLRKYIDRLLKNQHASTDTETILQMLKGEVLTLFKPN